MTREKEATFPEENFPQQGFNHPKKIKFTFVIASATDLIFGWFIHIWELWEPWRRRWEEPHKFEYLAMQTVLYAWFARAIVIFPHSAAVFVLSATCCGLFLHLCGRREHSATTFSFVLFITKVCFFNLSFGKLIKFAIQTIGIIKLYDCRNVKLRFWMRSRRCQFLVSLPFSQCCTVNIFLQAQT